jgi:hypothetical protein
MEAHAAGKEYKFGSGWGSAALSARGSAGLFRASILRPILAFREPSSRKQICWLRAGWCAYT